MIAGVGIAAALSAPAGAEERSASAGAADPSDARSGEGILGLSRTGKSRYDWAWLATRFDRDNDGTVTRKESGWTAEDFARLDRTWDGVLTAEDFDWSRESHLTKQKETAFALFKEVDKTSNGRISAEEWQDVFAKVAGEKAYLNA
jgi:hypothetical protein